jgi:hypothetical protein
MAITAAWAARVSYRPVKFNGEEIMTAKTSKPIPEQSRELTESELDYVSGGIIAVLIGISAPYEPPPPIKPGPRA